jgi:inner membrane protein
LKNKALLKMKKEYTTLGLSARIWILSSLAFAIGWLMWFLIFGDLSNAFFFIVAFIVASIGSLPVLLILSFVLPFIKNSFSATNKKIQFLVFICFMLSFLYGILGVIIDGPFSMFFNHPLLYLHVLATCTAIVFGCSLVALIICLQPIKNYFTKEPVININDSWQQDSETQINNYMETLNEQQSSNQNWNNNQTPVSTNKTLIKGFITAALILLMLIPSMFVQNIITEREERQKQVVNEVSSKWSGKQTITGPYIHIPYSSKEKDSQGKEITIEKDLIFLPDNLSVDGNITPEERPRSIYKVLLYKSSLASKGNFQLQVPKDITLDMLDLKNAKICMGISDFKGIEEKLTINFNEASYELSPGLPIMQIDSAGLSANITLKAEDFGKSLAFTMPLKIKGSEQLRFVPLSGNSNFKISSTWNNPSFDGNSLPTERIVNEKGFSAKWVFNKANLPFGTVLKEAVFNKNSFAFGVNMVQPADQYAKTMRSAKYAILFIGLTFALFFIIELMQKKPVHPVQYALIGIALVIFFTLLLSISEFILFDYAYWVAAAATITLITLYAKSHFQNWKTASVFAGVLTALYGFIFILIRLEDTALLVGSIGLFIVLALVMYATRKLNWYNPEFSHSANNE